MATIRRVAVIGASGNFGTPVTAALCQASLDVTIVTREDSTTAHPEEISVIRTPYDLQSLITSFTNQDAVVCVVGPGGTSLQRTFIDAAEAAGVKRFIVNDFGWGPEIHSLPEFDAVHEQRREGWDHARTKAEANSKFTWTGITTGNPIDWAIKKFPLMGFDLKQQTAIIYDDGTECFTGTTLAGIGQAVVGVLQNPSETANRFVKVLSIKTCQNGLLVAFTEATGHDWTVQRCTTKELKERGRSKIQSGVGGWTLDLAVAQLFDPGEARCVVAPSWGKSDSGLLGVDEESVESLVEKILARD